MGYSGMTSFDCEIKKANFYSFFLFSVTLLGGMLSTTDLAVPNGAGNSPVGE